MNIYANYWCNQLHSRLKQHYSLYFSRVPFTFTSIINISTMSHSLCSLLRISAHILFFFLLIKIFNVIVFFSPISKNNFWTFFETVINFYTFAKQNNWKCIFYKKFCIKWLYVTEDNNTSTIYGVDLASGIATFENSEHRTHRSFT